MRKHHPDNERIKRKYLIFQKEARQQHEATIDSIAKSLARFEEYTKCRDFKLFHFEQAVAFKRNLAAQTNKQTGKPLSKSTINIALNHLKGFFEWLSQQPGYKSRLNYSDAEYFNLSKKDTRIATAKRPTPVPTIEQIKHVLAAMPSGNDIELRNRALIAFTLLTGARDSATASLSLRHVNLDEGYIFQDARDVNTKFSKTFTTYFFPVGMDVAKIFSDWVIHLKNNLLWGNEDPIFPSTKIEIGKESQFEPNGLKREHWKTTSPIRSIFKQAFKMVELPYFNPHSFRNTLVRFGEQRCTTPEEFKAWSQNLGHQNVMTTFMSYGEVPQTRQAEILGRLLPNENTNHDHLAKVIGRMIIDAKIC
ncbi:MAG: site-specific integrase [Gammaproteobacteria bacterium]|nr:MAG: site-specific integrase [Gammaproteobacteria bacterium]